MPISPTTVKNYDTENVLLQKILIAILAGSGGSGGSGQIVTYTANPNTESLTPLNINSAAIAVPKSNSTLNWYNWDATNHIWF
jgi:hypothetical protein